MSLPTSKWLVALRLACSLAATVATMNTAKCKTAFGYTNNNAYCYGGDNPTGDCATCFNAVADSRGFPITQKWGWSLGQYGVPEPVFSQTPAELTFDLYVGASFFKGGCDHNNGEHIGTVTFYYADFPQIHVKYEVDSSRYMLQKINLNIGSGKDEIVPKKDDRVTILPEDYTFNYNGEGAGLGNGEGVDSFEINEPWAGDPETSKVYLIPHATVCPVIGTAAS